MRFPRKDLLALAVAAALAAPPLALAQQGRTQQGTSASQPPSGPTGGAAPQVSAAERGGTPNRPMQHEQTPRATQEQDRSGQPAETRGAQARNPHHVRASHLVGMDVFNTRGERLGDIEDMVIDLQSGQVRYAILSFGGFMGMGDDWFAYPTSAFRLDRGSNQLVLNVSRERLEAAKGFDKDRWPATTDRSFWDRIEQTFSTDRRPQGDNRAQANAQLVRASELLGRNVRDRQGQNVGEINDAVIDLPGRQVHYMVVEVDPGWFKSERLVPLPVTALSQGQDRDQLALDRNREQLRDAPAFESGQWPNFNEASTRQRYDRFHGSGGTDARNAATSAGLSGASQSSTGAAPRSGQDSDQRADAGEAPGTAASTVGSADTAAGARSDASAGSSRPQ